MWLRCTAVSLAVLLLLSAVPPARSQDAPAGPLAELVLVDGTTVRGRIVSETDAAIVIESPSLGRVEIDRQRIRTVTYDIDAPAATAWRDDPDGNSLLLVPTARTLPKGDVYYRNFLLLFNNLGYAVTDYLNLSVMAAFPVTSDVRILSLGAKVRLSPDGSAVGLAASGSVWIADDESVGTIGGIVTVGNLRRSATAAVHYASAEGDGEAFFLVGGDVQIGTGFKLLAEYGNSETAIGDDNDFKGIINVGFRLFWEETSFTLTGFRPLEEEGDFVAFPLAMFSAHF